MDSYGYININDMFLEFKIGEKRVKVLFISSGNSKLGISPIIKSQGDSLKEQGVDLTYFAIKEKGLKGYLKSIFELKKVLKRDSYSVVHAHYWLSGIVASLQVLNL